MKKVYFLICLFFFTQVSAVHINPKGLGDAAIIPYYTVNNNLNTLVSVTNTTADAKAIKINIREGLHGYAALSYNVYLDGYDTWTFALFPTDSTVAGYEGQKSASHATADTSCAPDLNKSGQEFLPFELTDGPNNLQRTREGFIEIIEMGTITGDAYEAANHINTGIPIDCLYFQQAWEANGIWHEDSGGNSHANLLPGSGGLMAEAQIVDVNEGTNYSIPTIALDGFHPSNTISHVSPSDTSLSLDAAEPIANIIADNKSYNLTFEHGIDAVSALLMADEITTTFALDRNVAGASETIFTQPTRRFYVDYNNCYPSLPFEILPPISTYCSQAGYGGSEFNLSIRNRHADYIEQDDCTSGLCPPVPQYYLLGSVSVMDYYLPPDTYQPYPPTRPIITRSLNVRTIDVYRHESGFISATFPNARYLIGTDIDTGTTYQIHGLPIFGITLQRFTNAAAAEGLLAQYGGTQLVKTTVKIEEMQP